MRFVCDSFVVRLLTAWGRLGVLCVEGVCVCDYAQYIQSLHAYDELAVFTGLMGATRYN